MLRTFEGDRVLRRVVRSVLGSVSDVDEYISKTGQDASTVLAAYRKGIILDYYENKFLGPDVLNVPPTTYQRAGTRYATGSDGKLYGPFGPNERRFVPGDGLRVTAGATNLLTYSEDFSNAVWSKLNASVAGAPIRAGLDFQLISRAAGSFASVDQVRTVSASTQYAVSVYAYPGLALAASIRAQDGAGNFSQVNYTWATKTTVVTESGLTAAGVAVQELSDGAVRISFAVTTGASTSLTTRLYAEFNGTGSTEWAGAQLETGSVATDYIPTTTSSASAGADEETFDLGLSGGVWTNLGGLDPSAGFTVFSEVSSDVANSNSYVWEISDGTNNNRILLRFDSSVGVRAIVVEAGSVTANIPYAAPLAPSVTHKFAVSAETNNLQLAVNGAATTPDASVGIPAGMNIITPFRQGAGAPILEGFGKRIAIIPGAYSDAQLQAWSGS